MVRKLVEKDEKYGIKEDTKKYALEQTTHTIQYKNKEMATFKEYKHLC